MKLLVALNNNNGVYSKLSEHFGHCLYFAVYETDTKELKFVENIIDHSDASSTPVDQIMKFNPDAVFSLGIGKRAINLFADKNISLKTGNFKILKDVLGNADSLEDLSEGCDH